MLQSDSFLAGTDPPPGSSVRPSLWGLCRPSYTRGPALVPPCGSVTHFATRLAVAGIFGYEEQRESAGVLGSSYASVGCASPGC